MLFKIPERYIFPIFSVINTFSDMYCLHNSQNSFLNDGDITFLYDKSRWIDIVVRRSNYI
jgi:hypothetical protein